MSKIFKVEVNVKAIEKDQPFPPLDVDCPNCEGNGKHYIGPRDPIEGNKMRSVKSCDLCLGRGRMPITHPKGAAFHAYWLALESSQDILTKKLEEERLYHQSIKNSALSKLTDEEKKVLGL